MEDRKQKIFFEVISPKNGTFTGPGYGEVIGYQHGQIVIFIRETGEMPLNSSEGYELRYTSYQKTDGTIVPWYGEYIATIPPGYELRASSRDLIKLAGVLKKMESYEDRLMKRGLSLATSQGDQLRYRIDLLERIGGVRIEKDMEDHQYYEYPAPHGRSSS